MNLINELRNNATGEIHIIKMTKTALAELAARCPYCPIDEPRIFGRTPSVLLMQGLVDTDRVRYSTAGSTRRWQVSDAELD